MNCVGSKFLTSPAVVAVVLGGVERGDFADSGFSSEEVFPKFLPADAQRGNDTQAGDDNTSAMGI